MAIYFGLIGGEVDPIPCSNIRALTVFFGATQVQVSPGPGLLWTRTGAGPGNVAYDDPVNGIAPTIAGSVVWQGGQPAPTVEWVVTPPNNFEALIVDGFLDCTQQGIGSGTTNCINPNDFFTFQCTDNRDDLNASLYGCCSTGCAGDFVMTLKDGGKTLCLPETIFYNGQDVSQMLQDYIDSL